MIRPVPHRSPSGLLSGLLLALALACVAGPAAAKSDGEKALAEFEAAGAVYDDERAAYVKRVGARVARAAGLEDGEITFNLLDDPSVNAFAMQGGYVFVARGLLAYLETEDQLAAVLGHEVGHLTGRHPQERKTAMRTSAIGSTLLGFITRSGALYQTAQAYSAAAISGYGREQELEADGLGARYVAAAGYDPIAMLEVIRILKDQDLFSSQVERRASSYHGLFASHPRNDRRLYEVIEAGGASAEPPEAIDYEGDFLSIVDALPWGDAAAEGLIRDQRYYHGSFGFVIDFPEGWRIADTPSAITSNPPHGTRTLLTVEMQKVDPKKLTPARFLAEELKLETEGGREIEVDGMPGYMAVVPVEGDEYQLRLVAVVFKDDAAFVMKGENRVQDFEGAFVTGFSTTVASFRRMRRSDVEAATTTRIRTIVASPDDSYETLARRTDLGREGADRLRLLNGDYPRGQPRAGDRIKIIE
ncbi:MAG: M48 family metalloprotease [Pseudomonadales bacterium]|jgi:predicted Zn-dependent protease|nr:M48 family metalloprotease [Pseudomonadales bacterium]